MARNITLNGKKFRGEKVPEGFRKITLSEKQIQTLVVEALIQREYLGGKMGPDNFINITDWCCWGLSVDVEVQ